MARDRLRIVRLYNPFHLILRRPSQAREVFRTLSETSKLAEAEKKTLTKAHGIGEDTCLLKLPTTIVFASFPVDTMNLCRYNTKDCIEHF